MLDKDERIARAKEIGAAFYNRERTRTKRIELSEPEREAAEAMAEALAWLLFTYEGTKAKHEPQIMNTAVHDARNNLAAWDAAQKGGGQ